MQEPTSLVICDGDGVSVIVLSSVGLWPYRSVSIVEIVNSKKVQIQVNNRVPTVSVDKSHGTSLFLSKDSLETQVFTSKSDELNLSIPGPSEEQPWLEFPIPEQFLNTIKGGKLHTETNAHLGE